MGYECNYEETISPCPPFFFSPKGVGTCSPCTEGYECIWNWTTVTWGTLSHTMMAKTDEAACPDGYYSGHFDELCIAAPKGHYAINQPA